MKHLVRIVALATTLAAAGTAHAQSKPYAEQARVLAQFLADTQLLRDHGAQFPGTKRPDEAACHEAIAQAVRAGARPEDRFYAGELEYYKPVGWAKDGDGAYILVKDASRICTTYGAVKRAIPAAAALLNSARSLSTLDKLKPEEVGDTYGAQSIAAADACIAAVDDALKAGIPAEVAFKIDDRTVTLAEGRAKICEAYQARARGFAEAAGAARKAAFEQFAGPYRALGVKGQRLELFAHYAAASTPFYAAGCRAEILDDKKLVKAKVLFHWLDNADGTYTVRKYSIKGDTYRITEKTFDRMAQAYKGCR